MDFNKAEHAVQSYAAGVGGLGAEGLEAWGSRGLGVWGPRAMGYIFNMLII